VSTPIVARQRLGRNVTAVTNTHATIEELLERRFQCGPYRIKESRRFVIPRTSCLFFLERNLQLQHRAYGKYRFVLRNFVLRIVSNSAIISEGRECLYSEVNNVAYVGNLEYYCISW
jgi:hypothetical protein